MKKPEWLDKSRELVAFVAYRLWALTLAYYAIASGRCARWVRDHPLPTQFDPSMKATYRISDALAYQLSRRQAILISLHGWVVMPQRHRAELNLFQDLLCMPFDAFHKAVEFALGRPVWTHEFADAGRLRREFLGHTKARHLVDTLPANKPVLIIAVGQEETTP